ncbi:MAG: hypothetical protein B7733_12975 [Myxococcales bacterium FL481]|nr:MAG: hypothetical protein B7733_12975 [Myxococcales bacterium FL481]
MEEWALEGAESPAETHWFWMPFGRASAVYEWDPMGMGTTRREQFRQCLAIVADRKQTGWYDGMRTRAKGIAKPSQIVDESVELLEAAHGGYAPILGLDMSVTREAIMTWIAIHYMLKLTQDFVAYGEPVPDVERHHPPVFLDGYFAQLHVLRHRLDDLYPHNPATVTVIINRFEVGKRLGLGTGWHQQEREQYMSEAKWCLDNGYAVSIDLTEWNDQEWGDFGEAFEELGQAEEVNAA